MLAALLRGTDWSKIADYLSPVLFNIVPPLAMAKQVQTLLKSYRDTETFTRLKIDIGEKLATSGWNIVLDSQKKSPAATQGEHISLGVGDRLLRLYFWQILSEPTAILDLRQKSWKVLSDQAMQWQPSPLYMAWDPDFIEAIRDMYRGFYQGNEQQLDRGLDVIGLKPGKAVLLEHFGPDQDQISFDLAHFRSSFHEIFVACKESKTRLHPNVLGLGAVLACLYEHLGELGGAYNVRNAFQDAEKLTQTPVPSKLENRYAT